MEDQMFEQDLESTATGWFDTDAAELTFINVEGLDGESDDSSRAADLFGGSVGNSGGGDVAHLFGGGAMGGASGGDVAHLFGGGAVGGSSGGDTAWLFGGETIIQKQTGTSADIEGAIRLSGIHTPDASWFLL